MNFGKIISVFIILLSFAILLGLTLGVFFYVPYGNIAVVKIVGEISSTNGNLLSQSANSINIAEKLREINSNPLIESVIIDINSGGGSSVASAEIVNAVKELTKPSVALIRDVGASGGYWIASACDYIIAHNLSMVGSLGVNMDYLEFSGLLKKYNVTYVNLSYPEHKDIFSMYRPLTDSEREWVQEWLEHAYELFVSDVALNRNMTREELRPYANGSIFLGYQALNYGLIDGLGGWGEAYNKSIELSNITEPILLEYDQGYSILDLISGLSGRQDVSLRT